MPDIITSIDYLTDLPLYQMEKPYVVVALSTQKDHPTNDLVFEKHDGVTITDIRGHDKEFTLETAGFEIMRHKTAIEQFGIIEGCRQYQKEMTDHLKTYFKAEYVFSWQITRRKNEPSKGVVRNLRDWTEVDGPANGPEIIKYNLPEEAKIIYLRPGFRFRIVNTWRSLIPVLEDNPLASAIFER